MIKPICVVALLAIETAPQTWPKFLGQGASAINPETIAVYWSPAEHIAWQATLPGQGQSSPVIWDKTVFVTSIEGSMKETCHVIALSLTDGRELWRRSIESAQPVRSTYTQSRSAPTPAVDSERIYAFFETGNVVAFDHQGNLQWERRLTEDYGDFESTIGLAASPTLLDDQLYILIDHEGPSYLLSLDTKSGETRWQTERFSRSSYASPSIVPINGSPQVVCSSSGSIDGYNPKTGELLWTYDEEVGGNRTGAALPFADGSFAVAASPGMHNEREEQARNTNFLMHVDYVDGGYQPKVLWKTDEAIPSFNSPLVHGDYAYWVNKVGVVFCFDAKTGEKLYAKRANGICWVTPVGLGDHVYLFGKDGITTVIAAGPEFKVLAENRLWDPSEDAAPRRRSSGHHSATDDAHGDDHATGETASSQSSAPSRNGRPDPAAEKAQPQSDEAETVDARFADPVQYGVAIVDGSLLIRTGSKVYCIRN